MRLISTLIARLAIILLAWAGTVTFTGAQGLPALYDVTGVAADDVLNIREAPSASTAIIGELAPDQTGVEVVEISGDGKWGLVNSHEQSCWTSLRFLTPVAGGAMPDWPHLTCFGTEPFWDVAIAQGARIEMRSLQRDEQLTYATGTLNPVFSWPYVFTGQDGPGNITVIAVPAQCNDGMSDREYGMRGIVVYGSAGEYVLNGCCSLDMR